MDIFKDWNIIKWFVNIGIAILLVCLLCYFINLSFAIGYLLLLLLHECGHMMAAKGYDIRMRFGGISFFGAHIEVLDHTTPKTSAVIALCGPLCGAFGAFLCWGLYLLFYEPTFLWLSFFTLLVSLLNLLPLPFFDGGKIVSATYPSFAYGLLLPLALLGYHWYLQENWMWSICIVAGGYIFYAVEKMRQQYRFDSLLYLTKEPKGMIFLSYLISICFLAGMIGLFLTMYQDAVFFIIQTR